MYESYIEGGATLIRTAVNTNTTTTIAAAQAGNAVSVVGVTLFPAADGVSIEFRSGSTVIFPLTNLSKLANGFVLPAARRGCHWLQTAKGEALVLHVTGGFVTGVVLSSQE